MYFGFKFENIIIEWSTKRFLKFQNENVIPDSDHGSLESRLTDISAVVDVDVDALAS